MSDEILDTLGSTQQNAQAESSAPSDTLVASDETTNQSQVMTETRVSETQESETQESETETEQPAAQEPEAPVPEVQEPAVQEPVMTEREFNIREMRKAKESAERETAAVRKRLAEVESQIPKEEEYNVGEDEFVEGKHLARMQARMNRLEAENQRISDLNGLSMKYPDYNSVMTPEAITRLEREEPEIAETLALAGQGKGWKKAAISIYRLIKKMNIANSYSKERGVASRNASKPRSLSTISPQQGTSPISRANEFAEVFDEAAKERLYLDSLAKAKLIE